MNSSRLPSGSRTYTLDASAAGDRRRARPGPLRSRRPRRRAARAARPAVPSQTKQRSPHGGRAFGARSVKLSRCHSRGPVEVDHLVADVHRHDVRVLGDVEPERPVERDHRVGVLHRQRHMVEAADGSGRRSASYGKP